MLARIIFCIVLAIGLTSAFAQTPSPPPKNNALEACQSLLGEANNRVIQISSVLADKEAEIAKLKLELAKATGPKEVPKDPPKK